MPTNIIGLVLAESVKSTPHFNTLIMKHFFRVGLVVSLILISFSANSQSRWKVSSDLSPVSRADNKKVLNNPQSFNLEWRNKLGLKLDNQTYAGISLSYRHYQLSEVAVSSESFPSLNLNYRLKNNLLGTGIFITRFLQVKPKLFLHATAFGMIEQGRGDYKLDYLTPICQDCFESQIELPLLQTALTTHETTFRERNRYGGIEVGSNFHLFPRIAFFTSLTLLQYEVYNTSDEPLEFQTHLPYDMRRPLIQKGNSFHFFTERPIFHFGISFQLDY